MANFCYVFNVYKSIYLKMIIVSFYSLKIYIYIVCVYVCVYIYVYFLKYFRLFLLFKIYGNNSI